MATNSSIPPHSPMPMRQYPALLPAADLTINTVTLPRQAQPPGPEMLRRLESIACNLPSITSNIKAMAWMTAIPLALGGINCANQQYLAAVPCFVTGACMFGTILFKTVFYPPALISSQLFIRLFPGQALLSDPEHRIAGPVRIPHQPACESQICTN